MLDVSVVIGFRDWGIQRLELAAKSILLSFGSARGEVILSDYGSTDRATNRKLAQELDIKYVYSDADRWSRSRALNAGFSVAKGQFLVSTDADMVFSPRSFERIVEIAQADPNSAYFLQCRDLPKGMDDEWVARHPGAWEQMMLASRLRPRWGMGGMMAISRAGMEEIRGFDERLHTYGGEDLDFAKRARRVGYRTRWIADPDVAMFHMWHPSSSQAAKSTPEGEAVVKANSNVVYHDRTFVRNTVRWQHPLQNSRPLVTVAISTFNRADLIRETITSVLAQSVQDFEVVVVNDGGTDETADILESFHDTRIRYFWQENQGISAARNRALDESRGLYTAVIDDDDLMHPRRLEWHLEGLVEETVGNVGSFMNFDDESGELTLHVSAKPALYTAYEKGAAPGHGTWFIKTDVLRKFRYDESITSGVDNNLMLRMLRSGIQLGHTGKPVTLRRMHSRQVTVTDADAQSGAAIQSLAFLRWGFGRLDEYKLAQEREDKGAFPSISSRTAMEDELKPFLPDHLVERDLEIGTTSQDIPQIPWDGQLSEFTTVVDGNEHLLGITVRNASYGDIARAAEAGLRFDAVVRAPEPDQPGKTDETDRWVITALEGLMEEGVLKIAPVVVSKVKSDLEDGTDVVLKRTAGTYGEVFYISQVDDIQRLLDCRSGQMTVIDTDYFRGNNGD